MELRAGQLLRAVVEQRGIDVVVAVQGPGHKTLLDIDGLTGLIGEEEIRWEAVESGEHVLEVRARAQSANPGAYTLRLEVLPAADEHEKAWMAAQRLFAEGRQAQNEGSGTELEHANVAFEAALPKWREAGDRRWEAGTLLNLGALSFRLSRFEAARGFLERALDLYRATLDRRGEGVTLSNLGNVHSTLSHYDQARDAYERALAINREVGDRAGSASILGNLGTAYKDQEQYDTALDFYEEALALMREFKNRRGEGVVLSNLGAVYGSLNQQERARVYYEQALAISREVKDRRREAVALNSLGAAAEHLQEYDRAGAYFHQSVALWREVKSRAGEGLTLNNLGDLSLAQGRYDEARDFYTQALQIHRDIGDRIMEATSLTCLGSAYRRLGDYGRAREHLEQALPIAVETKEKRAEIEILYELAVIARHHGELETARTHASAALAIIESIRSRVASHDLRSSFFASVQEYFALPIDILMQMHRADPRAGHDAAALAISERARARSLLDLLGEARADIRQGADAELLARAQELERQINAAALAQQQLAADRHTPEQAAALEQKVALLTGQYQDVQAQLRRTSPRYSALVEPQPLTLPEMQKLLDDDSLLLVYSVGAPGAERGYLWAVTPDSMSSFELPKPEVVDASVRRFLERLTKPRGPRAAAEQADYEKAAAAVSDLLLSPVASRLGRKRLIVVSDGVVQYVPFAALPVPKAARGQGGPQPLVVDHEIVYEPSVSSLDALRRELAGRTPAPRVVAVLADPVFGLDDERVSPSGRRLSLAAGPRAETRGAEALEEALQTVRPRGATTDLGRLPFARREAEAIAAAAPPGAAFKALDFQASRETATSDELGRYRIVHFATHGILNSARPELSGLVLSLVDREGRKQNGFLRLHDVYNLHLPAELVVLSACQTGLGREIKGEGLVGLTRGFMYAGAARVVASLWQVDDVATAELMRRFYGKMLRGRERPAAALRAAQVEMWREGVWRSSYYWAGFVLQGEWR